MGLFWAERDHNRIRPMDYIARCVARRKIHRSGRRALSGRIMRIGCKLVDTDNYTQPTAKK